jgi:hypothetical protein
MSNKFLELWVVSTWIWTKVRFIEKII